MPEPRPLPSTPPTERRLRGRAALPTSRPTASAPPAKTGSCWSRCWGFGSCISVRWTGVSARWWSPNAAIGAASPATAMASLRGSGPDPYRLNTRWATRRPGGCERRRPDQLRCVALRDRGPSRPPAAHRDRRRHAISSARATSGRRRSGGRCWRIIAVAVLFAAGAVLDWRAMTRAAHPGLAAIGLVGCVALARAVLMVAPAASWSSLPLFTAVTYASPAVPRLLSSPLDFLLTAIALTAHGARGACSGSKPPAAAGAGAGPSPGRWQRRRPAHCSPASPRRSCSRATRGCCAIRSPTRRWIRFTFRSRPSAPRGWRCSSG